MDWEWLTPAAKVYDLQNKLGFVTALAREGTICHDSMIEAERRWLRRHRTVEARCWRLLTDLAVEHLCSSVLHIRPAAEPC
ncbi:MAG TPA: hypothetical protein VF791_10690 [Pyrinomonadaceae bacterium]